MKNQNNHVKLYKFPANLRIPAMRHHVIDQVSFQLLVKQITKKINCMFLNNFRMLQKII